MNKIIIKNIIYKDINWSLHRNNKKEQSIKIYEERLRNFTHQKEF